MPSRIIREGWIESEKVAQLDSGAERFFLRLCLRADDFGRYHANPVLLRAGLFPLLESVKSAEIPRWVESCERAGLLRSYAVDGKRFLEIVKFGQRTRAMASKFPAPPENDGHMTGTCPTHDGQMTGICQADDGHPRTDTETETDSETKTKAPQAAQPVVALPSGLETDQFRAAWADWKQHRREIRHPLKPTAERAALAELSRMGEQRAIRAIRWTIFKGWRGLREPDGIEAKSFETATPQQQPIAEPADWRSFLNHEFPDSRFAAGQKDEAHEWTDLDRETQRWLAAQMRART